MTRDFVNQERVEKVTGIADDVVDEVIRASKLHPPYNSLHEAYAVILEELDEVWEQVKVNPNKLTSVQQANRIHELHKELIQVAATAIRTIYDLKLGE